MEFDLVIRGGAIADGTGSALQEGDVAIKDGKIAAVGKLSGSGKEEIDAKGKLVTPGFVDIHTHYDGQVTWSERLTPTSSHGVTTAITGNCGVGFAPCRPGDRDEMIRLMEGVEDIPEVVLSAGLPWNWETFPEYLDSIAEKPFDIDFAVLLPHSPLRVYAMGQRAIDLEPATEEDRAKMRALTKEAIEAGAIGFATSKNVYHKASNGNPVPSFQCEESELREIAMGMSDAGRGVFQGVLITPQQCLEDFEQFHRVARDTGRPLTYTLLSTNEAPDLWRKVLASVERDTASGMTIHPQIFNRPVGVIFGLDSNFSPFESMPYYVQNLAHLPFAERIAKMSEPEVKQALVSGQGDPEGRLYNATHDFAQLYEMTNPVNYEPDTSQSVAALAKARGVTPYEVMYDIVMANGGHGKIMLASMNYSNHNLDHVFEMMQQKDTVLGLGDGGAHCGIISDSSYSTTALMHWARDRNRGSRLSVEQVVRKLSLDNARVYGLLDRGQIKAGLKADLNVIDFDNLTVGPPEVVKDLPSGGSRLLQPPKGYEATIVSGVITQRFDKPTDALPGRLLRSGQLTAR